MKYIYIYINIYIYMLMKIDSDIHSPIHLNDLEGKLFVGFNLIYLLGP